MADEARRRQENVPGAWFVDDTCIDCGTCMWMAPQVFEQRGAKAAVHRQPAGPAVPEAEAALLSCPTGSIGGPARLERAVAAFPRPIAPSVWHMGFHDRRSFGATSYLAQTRRGMVLVDVPRFVTPLAERVAASGGLRHILLTHQDDVGAHERWHARFDAPRAIHEDDDRIGAEDRLRGSGGKLAGMRWIHVPGHTRGSVVYLHDKVLFTGDHLAGDGVGGLTAFRDACWYDWEVQTQSMRMLADLEVEHVLPGHGPPWHGPVERYRAAMESLLSWMEAQ